MSMNDLLSDMITRIRNGQRARLAKVQAPYSKLLGNVCEVLKREGFIRDWREFEPSKGCRMIEVELKYHEGEPAIKEITRISKPGRREYSPIRDLNPFYNGLGIKILSTSKGVFSDYEARQQNVGGEVLCRVF
jgi:small subunit ribosomal protein S8